MFQCTFLVIWGFFVTRRAVSLVLRSLCKETMHFIYPPRGVFWRIWGSDSEESCHLLVYSTTYSLVLILTTRHCFPEDGNFQYYPLCIFFLPRWVLVETWDSYVGLSAGHWLHRDVIFAPETAMKQHAVNRLETCVCFQGMKISLRCLVSSPDR